MVNKSRRNRGKSKKKKAGRGHRAGKPKITIEELVAQGIAHAEKAGLKDGYSKTVHASIFCSGKIIDSMKLEGSIKSTGPRGSTENTGPRVSKEKAAKQIAAHILRGSNILVNASAGRLIYAGTFAKFLRSFVVQLKEYESLSRRRADPEMQKKSDAFIAGASLEIIDLESTPEERILLAPVSIGILSATINHSKGILRDVLSKRGDREFKGYKEYHTKLTQVAELLSKSS